MPTLVRKSALLVIVVASVVAISRPAAGQFGGIGIGNILGGAKDLAVKQALSQFGKSLGAQLPIVVDDGDAYPTTETLPGAPFRPGTPPPNLTSLLKASTDGTVPLKPGDYAMGVNVFCMRVRAHSPAGYHYLVAPLKGSAADTITALDARAPAMHVEHTSLQVLSWNIQAGLPYDAMQPAQKSIVDKVIPDYRSHLNTDVYESMRAKYSNVSSAVPGMPGFEDALNRIGPAGQAVMAMEQVRQQMAQPPATFAQLAAMLVPAGAGNIPIPSGVTPWSRYSDRVFVRFVTSGNYAQPGTYQVRVLPAAAVSVASRSYVSLRSLALGGAAPVPMSNIVNNPGTGGVQPLTQGPTGGAGSNQDQPTPPPTPTPTPSAEITSQTVATSPSDRSRTSIGVAEEVKLTFSGDNASWSTSGSFATLDKSSGKTVTLYAGDTAGSGTITATDTTTQAVATISFTVIAPSGIFNERVPGSMIHDRGWPNSGFNMHVYLQPDTVSFSNLEYIEHDVKSVATGIYSYENNVSHDPSKDYTAVGADVPGKGSEVQKTDQAYSGYGNIPPPFAPGHVSWNIPLFYKSQFHPTEYHFADVLQDSTLEGDGKTLKTVKGNASAQTSVAAPTINQ